MLGPVPIAYVRALGELLIDGSASASGGSNACAETCDWSVGIEIASKLTGTVEAALITSMVDLDILKVAGDVTGSGSFEGTVDCHGDWSFEGCFGKVTSAVKVFTLGMQPIGISVTLNDGWCL